jgi:hypothetical protein
VLFSQSREPELSNWKETALNIQNHAAEANREKLKTEMDTVSQKWREAGATLESKIVDSSTLTKEWEVISARIFKFIVGSIPWKSENCI